MAISCRTVVGAEIGYAPGLATFPVRNTFRLLIALTTTVTDGSSISFDARSVSCSRNCSGVRPAACTSFSNGNEIFPSGLTCTSPDMSFSRQNTTTSTSSGPMT